MKTMASSGKILPDDTVWQEGVQRGVPARRVNKLFSPSGSARVASPAVTEAPPPQPVAIVPGEAPAVLDSLPRAEGTGDDATASEVPAIQAPPLPRSTEGAGALVPDEKGPGAPPAGWQQGPARTG